MTRRGWYFAVALAFAVHNAEEGLAAARLLAFVESRGPAFLRDFYNGLDAADLRISLAILTAAGALLAWVASRKPTSRASSYVLLVFAAVIGLNALAHVALSLAAGAYMPGLITAAVVTLPLALLVLLRGRREQWVTSTAYWTVFPTALLVHGPVLAGFIRVSAGIAQALTGDT